MLRLLTINDCLKKKLWIYKWNLFANVFLLSFTFLLKLAEKHKKKILTCICRRESQRFLLLLIYYYEQIGHSEFNESWHESI